jgi:hypothetical protein
MPEHRLARVGALTHECWSPIAVIARFAVVVCGSWCRLVSQECVEYASWPVVVVRTDRLVGDGDVILVGGRQ